MTNVNFTPSKGALLAQLDRIQQTSTFSRSKNYSKLLSYLVEREVSAIEEGAIHKSPKEIEIAIDVFGKSSDFNPSEDATVRVHISNLRKKLETYYKQEQVHEDFHILVPTGEYRLLFLEQKSLQEPAVKLTENVSSVVEPTIVENQSRLHPQNLLPLIILLTLVLLVSVSINLVMWLNPNIAFDKPLPAKVAAVSEQNTNIIWQDIQSIEEPILVVIGGSKRNVLRGSVEAYKQILMMLADPKQAHIRLIEELTVRDIFQHHIVYIGDFNSMGILKGFYKGSNFSILDNGNILQDNTNSQQYLATKSITSQYKDYGLFAKFDGPTQKKIYVIAGFTNSALRRTTKFLVTNWSMTSKAFVTKMHQNHINDYQNVEILFKIPSLNSLPLKSHEIIYAGKVAHQRIWK